MPMIIKNDIHIQQVEHAKYLGIIIIIIIIDKNLTWSEHGK